MLAHMMLANVMGSEMLCTESEALRIATAWIGFRRQYGGFLLDPKHQAIGALLVALGTVEIPKLRQRMARRRAEVNAATIEQAARDQAPGGTVVPIDPTNPAFRGGQPGNGFPLHG